MDSPATAIEGFYSAFQKLDGETMASFYHPEVEFSDPVFPSLKGDQAGAMWKMLCKQAQGFELSYSGVSGEGASGSAHWEAKYDFSLSGRRVHNKIDASFQFQDGKIIRHVDTFNFYAWTRMALGFPGLLLGWTPLIQNKIRAQAAKNLAKFQSTN